MFFCCKRILAVPALLAMLTLLFAGTASAQSASELTSDLQAKYDSLASFESEFTQVLRNAASGEEDLRTGKMFFKKPQLIRWENLEPEPELLVIGQDIVWDYFEFEEAAYKYPVSDILNSKTMIRFISGQSHLEQDFYVDKEGEEDGLVKLSLVPKEPETQLVQAYVWVDPATHLFKRILLLDFYNNENDLTFENLKENPNLSDDMFTFTPPEGVEIFDNTQVTE